MSLISNNPDHLSQLIQVSRKGTEPDLSGDLDSVGMRQGTQERYGNWWIPCPLISYHLLTATCVSVNGLLWGHKPQEGAMVPSPTWQHSRRCQWKSEESEKQLT